MAPGPCPQPDDPQSYAYPCHEAVGDERGGNDLLSLTERGARSMVLIPMSCVAQDEDLEGMVSSG